METTPTETGPVVDAQTVALPVPDTIHDITPAGATELVVPVTVAVKTTKPPRVGVLAELFVIVGVAFTTAVVEDEVVAETEL